MVARSGRAGPGRAGGGSGGSRGQFSHLGRRADANDVALCFMVHRVRAGGRGPRRGPVRDLPDQRAHAVAADLARPRPLPAAPALAPADPRRPRATSTARCCWPSPTTRLWTPDFLNPRPSSPLDPASTTSSTAWRECRSTSCARTSPRCTRTRRSAGGAARTPRPRRCAGSSQALADYWTACFEPWWPRMRAVLEADIVLPRAHVIAPRRPGRDVRRALAADPAGRQRRAGGAASQRRLPPLDRRRGLTLVPTLFTRNATTPISADEPPMILYGARGVGTLWESRPARGAATPWPAWSVGARARLLAAARSAGVVHRAGGPSRRHHHRGQPAPAGDARRRAAQRRAARPVGALPAAPSSATS